MISNVINAATLMFFLLKGFPRDLAELLTLAKLIKGSFGLDQVRKNLLELNFRFFVDSELTTLFVNFVAHAFIGVLLHHQLD